MQTQEIKNSFIDKDVLEKTKIAVAKGDGIGPEIMDATLKILDHAGANIEVKEIEIGEKAYLSGNTSGITQSAWDTINEAKILLKAPITTPQGSGYKSLNVTIRKSLNLFANVRPCKSLHPFVKTLHPNMDVVIVRENEEDLYAGIEHQQTPEVIQCLKLVSIPGSKKIIQHAFEYARQNNRKKVTCMVKDNIMKLTDGMFHRVFDEIGSHYPEIEKEIQIIDIGAAKLANQPHKYDVVVTLNLYGDIISDITAEIAGSVGLAGSSNIGQNYAMFEAIHGSAPDIAGKNIANPSGLINGAVMMLQHIGQSDVAEKISNAWLKTLEDGIHTADIYNPEFSSKKVSCSEFADAVVARLGNQPRSLKSVKFNENTGDSITIQDEILLPKGDKTMVGIDVFVDHSNISPDELGKKLEKLGNGALKLKMITNRGVKVYPNGNPETFCTDHWRCRFVNRNVNIKESGVQYLTIDPLDAVTLQSILVKGGIDVIKTENLYQFDDYRGFSLGQGE